MLSCTLRLAAAMLQCCLPLLHQSMDFLHCCCQDLDGLLRASCLLKP
jgi:hypothetical protein